MTSDWREGILLVILLFFGLFLIILELVTHRHAKKKASKSLIIWDDAGLWLNSRDWIKQYYSKLNEYNLKIYVEEESKNES